jgi:hypothetical protein
MVQLLPDPAFSPCGTPIHEAPDGWRSMAQTSASASDKHASGGMSREEHAHLMKELNAKRAMMKTPRRGWSMTEYQAESVPDVPPPSSIYAHHQPGVATPNRHVDRHPPSIPENGPLPASSTVKPSAATPAATTEQSQASHVPRRPKLPPPRRSYSVTDYEPPMPPGQPRPSARLTLLDLPSELHYSLLDFLDPIDSVCFGLAHPRFYPLHRRKYGTVPLSSRYSGPNDMEWAWRGAGPLVHPDSASTNVGSKLKPASTMPTASAASDKALGQLRVKGQVYCRKCGVYRCELHRHLRAWMPPGMEYCEIKETFGSPAGPDAKPYCFMSSPKNPNRCGRHGGRKISKPVSQ